MDSVNRRVRLSLILSLSVALLAGCAGASSEAPDIQSEADLSGLRVCAVTGSWHERTLSKREDLTLIDCHTPADCIEQLRKGMCDVMAADEFAFTKSDLERQGIRMAFQGDTTYAVAFAFRKDSPLRGSFNTFLSEIRSGGTLDELLGFWLDPQRSSRDRYPDLSSPEGGERPLRVGTAITTAPVSFEVDGHPAGVDIELSALFAARLGRPLQVFTFDLASLMMALQSGRIDMMIGNVSVTEERSLQVAFSEPYNRVRAAYFVVDTQQKGASFWKRLRDGFRENLIVERRWHLIVEGLFATLRITFLAILLGSLLGAGICAMGLSRRRWLQKLAHFYVALMHGIPMLVLLLIMFYLVLSGTGMGAGTIAAIAFALHFAAASGVLFMNAIRGVPAGQREAALALGFTPAAAFFHIVLPQAVRRNIALYKGQCIALLKETAIVGYISIHDLAHAGSIIRNQTFDAFLPLLLVTLIYFFLTWLLGFLLDLPFKHRRPL